MRADWVRWATAVLVAAATVVLLAGCWLVKADPTLGSSASDASASDASSDARAGDAGATGRPAGLLCGDASCAPNPQYVCCLRTSSSDTSFADGTCDTADDCPGWFFRCQRPSDCDAGEVCCATTQEGTQAQCAADCFDGVVLCDPTGADQCPGQTCYASVGNAYPGLGSCGP